MARRGPEAQLLSQVLAWLKLHGLPHWRNNTGAMKVGRRFVRFGTPGLPDVVVVLPPCGRFVGLELKAPKGRLSPEQRAVGTNLEAAGAAFVVVRSIEDLEAGLRGAGWQS